MNPESSTCDHSEHLRLLLDERLEASLESSLVDHVGACVNCQRELEEMTARQNDWNAARQLKETGVHGNVATASTNRQQLLEQVRLLLAPSEDPCMLGRLGCYEVCGLVGQGSTGIVFKAFDVRLNRTVAIKLLAPVFSGSGSAQKRFEREARAIAAVSNEHVVPVYAVDEHRGIPFLVMKYLPGGSLQHFVETRGPLQATQVVRLGIHVATGLAAAHKQGLVHRDVKPANVMLESGVERAMVSDFGLARIMDDTALTHSGTISGTPQYMSPEQATGKSIDGRSDLFSLASVLYYASTGRSPFRSDTVFGVIKRVCESSPRPIRESNPDIPSWLEALVARLHQKDPGKRIGSATELVEILNSELAHLQNPTVTPLPERGWWVRSSDIERSTVGALRPWKFAIAATLVFGLLWAAGWLAPDWMPYSRSSQSLKQQEEGEGQSDAQPDARYAKLIASLRFEVESDRILNVLYRDRTLFRVTSENVAAFRPSQQSDGFRLDPKSGAGGLRVIIRDRKSESSFPLRSLPPEMRNQAEGKDYAFFQPESGQFLAVASIDLFGETKDTQRRVVDGVDSQGHRYHVEF